MAEFCLDCWNKMNGTNETEADYVLSRELDLCEGCGKYRHVIVRRRMPKFWDLFSLDFPRKKDDR